MRRYERDGKVALILASRPGGGRFAPNRAIRECLTEPVIVAMLLRGAGLAEVVAEAIRRLNVTSAGLAERLGVSPRTVETWRSCGYPLTSETAYRLASLLAEATPDA